MKVSFLVQNLVNAKESLRRAGLLWFLLRGCFRFDNLTESLNFVKKYSKIHIK